MERHSPSAPERLSLMTFELSERFYFEAAHTLVRDLESESSRRIHGHTYFAEVALEGEPDSGTGMILDLGYFRAELARVRALLDHRLLNEVPKLTAPTLEGLCRFIAEELIAALPHIRSVRVWREPNGDSCIVRVPSTAAATK